LVEGDTFGVDQYLSWRDYFSFNWYIEDISLVDLSYGYVYFGGSDYTPAENAVRYKWFFSSISGSLHNGWNDMELEFRSCDEIDYTEASDEYDNASTLDLITLSSIGLFLRVWGTLYT
jgi:hypothetical protein